MDWDSEFSLNTQSCLLSFRPAVQELISLVHNERRSPELLPFEHATISQVQSTLTHQHNLLDARKPEDREIYLLDLDRVTYLLKSYFRLRLFKINTYHKHYATNSECLRDSEKQVCMKINLLEQKHFFDSFLHCLPEGNFQSVERDQDGSSMVAEPDCEVFCFYKALETVGDVSVEGGVIGIEAGGVYLGKYSHVRGLVMAGKVKLV
jgi:GINS complex subunit 4